MSFRSVRPAEPGPVTVELTGITQPATFARIPDALSALWESMRALPLGQVQFLAYELYLTRPDAEQHVAERLTRQGELVLTFWLGDALHLLRINPAQSARTPVAPSRQP
jgi:hypothetical protein